MITWTRKLLASSPSIVGICRFRKLNGFKGRLGAGSLVLQIARYKLTGNVATMKIVMVFGTSAAALKVEQCESECVALKG